MSEVSAYQPSDIPATAPLARATAILNRASRDLRVEIAGAERLCEIREAWTGLVARAASPNVFMNPALTAAAVAAEPGAQHRTVLCWKPVAGRQDLVGIWTFAIGRAPHSLLPASMLVAPRERHGHLGTPVIDASCIDDVLTAMLDAVEADPALPKIIAIEMMNASGPTWDSLHRVLDARGSRTCVFAQAQRPKLQSDLDGKAYLEKSLSSSTRKKLRQHRRRLSEKGTLASVVISEPAAVREAMEQFLSLEASGWKGKQGTALLSKAGDAAFMRGAVSKLADLGCASMHMLTLDGKPISMQIVARAGAAAFTWKTTYDEAYHDFSPGALLLEDYTTAFLADKSIAFVDSCSFDDSGFMSAWTERIAVADLWFDARRGGSVAFSVLSQAQRSYCGMRATAKRGYHAMRQWRKARKH